jgi:uncharacterized membrane protein
MAKVLSHRLLRIDAQHRLYLSLAITAIVFFLARTHVGTPALVLVSWFGFCMSLIILNWIVILSSHPREVRKLASLKDSSAILIFSFVILSAVISLLAIIMLLQSSKTQGQHFHATEHILMSIGSVVSSWWMVHTVFTMRYAHMYYTTTPETNDPEDCVIGGLSFPDETMPDYLDFVYFSFVVGMTFQVSDVEISNRSIRRLCLVHAIVSFAFNTAIVALSINVISGLV